MRSRVLLTGVLLTVVLLGAGCLITNKPLQGDDNDDGILFAPTFGEPDDLLAWTTSAGSWTVGTGDYVGAVAGEGTNGFMYYPGYRLPETFKVSAKIRMPARGKENAWWAGLVFYVDQSEIHVVRWKADGALQSNVYDSSSGGLVMKTGGYSAVQFPQPIPVDEYVMFSIEKDSNGVSVSVNGAVANTNPSSAYPLLASLSAGSQVGFYVVSGDPSYFKELVVEEL